MQQPLPIEGFSMVPKARQGAPWFGRSQCDIQNKGVCPTVTLPFTLKRILRQKKNYGNSNISPLQKHNLQKNPLKETKILQDIITLL
jgi:hypothetical protein